MQTLKSLLEDWDRLLKAVRELEENPIFGAGADPELAELAQAKSRLSKKGLQR